MKHFLRTRQGQTLRLIFELNAQKQPTQYLEGPVLAVGEDALMIKDAHIGDIAVNYEKILAVQVLQS